MKTIQVGTSIMRRIMIDKPRTIDFLGEELRVYATPELVRDIEATCRGFLLGFVDTGEDSVGLGTSIPHKGTPSACMSTSASRWPPWRAAKWCLR